eukprot:4285779-Pyramimonas_sp.AAC.1
MHWWLRWISRSSQVTLLELALLRKTTLIGSLKVARRQRTIHVGHKRYENDRISSTYLNQANTDRTSGPGKHHPSESSLWGSSRTLASSSPNWTATAAELITPPIHKPSISTTTSPTHAKLIM